MNQTYHFHPSSVDHNLNFGPSPDDDGWIEVSANSYEDAYTKLSSPHQTLVQKAFKNENREMNGKDWLSSFIEDTCLTGAGFTIIAHGEWNDFTSQFEDEE